MKNIGEPPYKTSFSSVIKPVIGEEKDKYLSLASLKEVADLIPNELISDNKNSDLLPVAFNAFVANRSNKKDDICDSATAVEIAKFFSHKPINVEHNRSNNIGTIVSYRFSEFGSDQPLTEEEALATTKPFNVVLGGVIWKVVNKELIKVIEDSSDPSSDSYEKVSASWEVGFTEFKLAVNSKGSKNLEDCEIIEDEKEIEGFASSMKSNGGSGLKDEKRVFRLVSGSVIPLGIGFTESPAADVKGIATNLTLEEEELEVSSASKTELNDKKFAEKTKTTSRANKNVVIQERKKTMKIKKIEDITQENLEQIEASQITDFIKNHIKDADESYRAERDKIQIELDNEKVAVKELEASSEETLKNLKKVQEELNALKEAAASREKQDAFDARMSKLDETFSLTDEEKEAIASDIINLDEEAFAKYETKLSVFLKRGTTEEPKETKASEKIEEAKASETTAEKELDDAENEAEKEKQTVANTSEAESSGYFNKYKKHFAADGWISDLISK